MDELAGAAFPYRPDGDRIPEWRDDGTIRNADLLVTDEVRERYVTLMEKHGVPRDYWTGA